jgi:hypothetical protein
MHSSLSRSQDLDKFRNAIIPICGGYEKPSDSIIHTIGNGILFEYDNYIWILSVRHLIEPESNNHTVKAVVKWEGTNYILILNKPELLRFHPDDNDVLTSDLALYCFGRIENFKAGNRFFRLQSAIISEDIREDEELFVIGYPSHLLNPKIIFQNKTQPVKAYKGNYIDETISIKPRDFTHKLSDQHIINMGRTGAYEMSGGLVIRKANTLTTLTGLVTGSGDVKIKISENEPEQLVQIITFTSLSKLFELF